MNERLVDRERAVIAHDESPEVAKPGDVALDDPALLVASQHTPVLRRRPANGSSGAEQSGSYRDASAVRAARRCRSPYRQSPVRAFVLGARPDATARLGSPEAFLPPAELPTGKQSKVGFPEEHRGRRHPPSTSSPCPAWFCRLRSPLFRRRKTAVLKRFALLQLLPPI